MQAERRAFKLKETELQQKLKKIEKEQQNNRQKLSDSQKQLKILEGAYQMKMNGKSPKNNLSFNNRILNEVHI